MLAFVRRRALLVVLTAVAVAVMAYLIGSLRPVTYSADSVLVVPSGGNGGGPGAANEALRLASTYAELIPRDGDVLVAVAEALTEPEADVATRLSVAPLGDTALLQVRYTSPVRERALLGSRTAAESVTEGVATSDTVPRGSVRLVSLAEDSGVVVQGGVTRSTIPVGVVLGLGLGLVLAVAAERANRRLDRPGQVGAVLDVPVFELGEATYARREALLRRWRDNGTRERTTLVAVTGAGVDYEQVVAACERLVMGLSPREVSVRHPGAPVEHRSHSGAAVEIVPSGAPGTGQPYEEVVREADLVVLLVPQSVEQAVVRSTVTDLVTYGSAEPGFVVFERPAREPRPRATKTVVVPRERESESRDHAPGGPEREAESRDHDPGGPEESLPASSAQRPAAWPRV